MMKNLAIELQEAKVNNLFYQLINELSFDNEDKLKELLFELIEYDTDLKLNVNNQTLILNGIEIAEFYGDKAVVTIWQPKKSEIYKI